MRTRDEHVEWSKQRAREYLKEGDVKEAITSMLSDMSKHPECRVNAALASLGLLIIMNHDQSAANRFIEGFK